MLRKPKTGPWRSLHFRVSGEEEGLKKHKEEKQESEETRKSGRVWLCRIRGRERFKKGKATASRGVMRSRKRTKTLWFDPWEVTFKRSRNHIS